jgi:hypothetical protein
MTATPAAAFLPLNERERVRWVTLTQRSQPMNAVWENKLVTLYPTIRASLPCGRGRRGLKYWIALLPLSSHAG